MRFFVSSLNSLRIETSCLEKTFKELKNAAIKVESFATFTIPLIKSKHKGCNCNKIVEFLIQISFRISIIKGLVTKTALA